MRTKEPSVILKLEVEVPELNAEMEKLNEAVPIESAAMKPHEETLETDDGVIARYREVEEGEEPHEQVVRVYLNDKLVKTFSFSLGASATRPPAPKTPK